MHSKVAAVVLEAYAQAGRTMPEKVFVYGETGKKEGGEFEPHKMPRNGLSVDFDAMAEHLYQLHRAARDHDEHYHVDFAFSCEPAG